jgi:parallel beta-helix repeat protein
MLNLTVKEKIIEILMREMIQLRSLPRACLMMVVLGLIIFTGFCSLSFATTYYVTPTGNDNWSGTSVDSAWQHVKFACQVATAGDTVLIRAGTYNESSGINCWPGPADCGTLYPRNNGTPGNPIVFKGFPGDPLPVIEGNNGTRYAVSLNGKSYIVLDSLEVKRGYRGIMACGHDLAIKNCVSDSNSGPAYNNTGGVCVLFNGGGTAYNILIENCTFFHNYDPIGGANCSGIHIYSAESCTLRNNTIYDQTIGIYIKGNTVGNGGYNDSIYIHDNVIYDVGSGIEVHGQGTMRDIFVYNNIIYNFSEDGLSQSIGSADGQVTNCLFYNNVVDGGAGNNRGFAIRFGTDSTRLYNNIFYNCGDNGGDYRREMAVKGEEPTTHFMEDYNCVWDTNDNLLYYWIGSNWTLSQWRANTDNGDHTISQDPLFVDPASHDYHLQPSSPCIGTGLGGMDMGAYPSPPSDTIPPTIFDVGATNLTHNSATICWTTDEPATSQVEYGLTTNYGLSTTLDPNLVTTHSQNLTGLSSNILYHYRVRSKDAAGNERISSDYTFTTTDQDTIPPVISNVQSSGITYNSATISWDTDEPATSQVEYGLDISYGNTTALDSSLATNHTQVLTELDADTTYHYRVISRDGQGNEAVGSDYTFTTASSSTNLALGITASVDGTYPGYTINPITDGVIDPHGGTATTWASDESSTLPHWIVIDFGENHRVGNVTIFWAWNDYQAQWMTPREYHIQHWDGSDYLNAAVVTDPPIGSVTISAFPEVITSRIRVYQPANMGPEFYPEVIWLTELEIYGLSDTVDTTPPTTEGYNPAPDAVDVPIDANIVFHLTDSGEGVDQSSIGVTVEGEDVSSSLDIQGTPFDYTITYDSPVDFGYSQVVDITIDAQDLASPANVMTTFSYSFTTQAEPDTAAPIIYNVSPSNIATDSVTITWDTDEPATSQVEYGLTASYGSTTTLDTNLVTTHSQILSGLSTNTLYHYRVRSKDEAGNERISSDYTFTTLAPPDTTPPIISNIIATEITRREATISWNTDEAATSLVEYGLTPSYGSSTDLDTNLVTDHSQRLTKLHPHTLYHYRARSKDRAGNEAISQDYTFTTAKKPIKPRPISPSDDSTLGVPNPDLVILNGIDSLGFELLHLFQIDTTSNFNSPNMQESSPFGLQYVDDSTTMWTVPQELSVGTYYWRAYAYTNASPSDTSDPSEVFSFRITYTDAMDTVYQLTLEYPLQNDTVPTIRPTFVARLISGSMEMNLLSCQFEVSEDPHFSNNVLSSERITFYGDRTARWEVTQDLKQNTRFYWRAKLYSQDRLLDVTQTFTIFTEAIHVFPNPFKPSLGHSHVTFRNIPLNSTIMVTTISGDLVKTFDNTQQTDIVWDVKSEDQKELASGVYLYQVSHRGKVSSGKIFVIR